MKILFNFFGLLRYRSQRHSSGTIIAPLENDKRNIKRIKYETIYRKSRNTRSFDIRIAFVDISFCMVDFHFFKRQCRKYFSRILPSLSRMILRLQTILACGKGLILLLIL